MWKTQILSTTLIQTSEKLSLTNSTDQNSKANLPTPTLQNKQEVEAELEKAKADKKTAEDNLEQVKTELQEIEKRIADLEKEVI